jgi:tripartite-type tricarboxylate transporter receptor subunit TctC
MKKLTLLATLLAASGMALAQAAYPSKIINVVVPFAAGGPTDVVARALADVMGKNIGQSMIVDNKPGAGGTLGTGVVAKANPDGHTLLLMHIGFTTAPLLYRKALNYDAAKDFEPIGLVVDVPMTVIANNTVPAKNFKEFQAYVAANKAKVNLANAGVGSASHLCGMLLMSALKTDVQTIPYSGTGPAMTALRGNQVDFMCDQSTNTSGQIASKTVKAFAVTSSKRLTSMPDVPTLDEEGLKGFQLGIWHGLWAPKGTPKAVQEKLVAALQKSLNDAAFKDRMTKLGAVVYGKDDATPAALNKTVLMNLARWSPIIAKSGAYAD